MTKEQAPSLDFIIFVRVAPTHLVERLARSSQHTVLNGVLDFSGLSFNSGPYPSQETCPLSHLRCQEPLLLAKRAQGQYPSGCIFRSATPSVLWVNVVCVGLVYMCVSISVRPMCDYVYVHM